MDDDFAEFADEYGIHLEEPPLQQPPAGGFQFQNPRWSTTTVPSPVERQSAGPSSSQWFNTSTRPVARGNTGRGGVQYGANYSDEIEDELLSNVAELRQMDQLGVAQGYNDTYSRAGPSGERSTLKIGRLEYTTKPTSSMSRSFRVQFTCGIIISHSHTITSYTCA